MEPNTQSAVRLCALNELNPGGARRFDIDGRAIAVVRIDDDVYAVGDRCTHQNVSLSEGEVHVEDVEIECYRHGSTFSLVTGKAMNLPATKPTPVYDVQIHDGDVYLRIDE